MASPNYDLILESSPFTSWQLFSVSQFSKSLKTERLPSKFMSGSLKFMTTPPINLNRWMQAKSNSSDHTLDNLVKEISSLHQFVQENDPDLKILLRLRVVDQLEKLLDLLLTELPEKLEFISQTASTQGFFLAGKFLGFCVTRPAPPDTIFLKNFFHPLVQKIFYDSNFRKKIGIRACLCADLIYEKKNSL